MSAPRLTLAVDGGGTRTRVCLAKSSATEFQVIGQASAGPSNPAAVGLELAKTQIAAAIRAAFEIAGLDADTPIHRALVGLAGLEATDAADELEAWARQQFHLMSVSVMTDVDLLLLVGMQARPAIVIISGTGSVACGRSQRHRARCGGRGYLLGDEGSGYWIGQQGMAAAIRTMDHVGPATLLVEKIGQSIGASTPDEWTIRVYTADDPRDLIAQQSQHVITAAAEHDDVAENILQHAAENLLMLIKSVARQLQVVPQQYDLLIAGGILINVAAIRDMLLQRIRDHFPASEIRMIADPALEAARKAVSC